MKQETDYRTHESIQGPFSYHEHKNQNNCSEIFTRFLNIFFLHSKEEEI